MRVSTRILAFFTVVAMVFTGCNATDTTWIYEKDGTRIPAGVYISYQLQAMDEAQSKLYEVNADNADFTMPQKLADIAKLDLEGVTVEQWVSSKAREYAKSYYIVQREAARLNVSLSAEEMDSLKSGADSLWGYYGEQLEQSGVSKNSYIMYQQNEALRSRIFDNLYNAGGEREVSDQELTGVFTRDYAKADILYLLKPSSVSEGESLEAKIAERKAMAESYLERLRAGESIEDVEYEYRRETAADEAAKEAVTKKEPGALTSIYHREDSVYYSAGYVEAIFDAAVNQPAMAEGESYYILIIRKDIMTDDPQDFANYRATLIVQEKLDEYEAWMSGESDALQVTVNQPAADRYKVAALQGLYS